MNTTVLYHADCVDGFTAAWLLWKHFYQEGARYVPVKYGEDPPWDDVTGKRVMIVDFSYKRPVMEKIKELAETLTVLDHHKTAEEELKGLYYCTFDMNKSGAMLVWDLLFPGREAPPFVKYVQDHDLRRFELYESKKVRLFIQAQMHTFRSWDALSRTIDMDVQVAVDGGSLLSDHQEKLVQATVAGAWETEFAGCKVLCANVSSQELVSEVGHRLAEGRAFGMTFAKIGPDRVQYSLRSREQRSVDGASPTGRAECGADVSEIARRYGGGGHRHAAGFVLNTQVPDPLEDISLDHVPAGDTVPALQND